MGKRVVVLLPEGKLSDDLFAESIAPAAAEAGVSVTRLSVEFSAEDRLGTTCNALESAELIIADLSAKNPNVMYLAGYGHGIGRKVVFTAQHVENFPFDRAKHEVIGYGSDRQFLKSELLKVLRGEKPEKSSSATEAASGREKFLAIFGDILKAHQHEHRGDIYLENPTTFVLVNQDMDLALVQELSRRAREQGVRLKLM